MKVQVDTRSEIACVPQVWREGWRTRMEEEGMAERIAVPEAPLIEGLWFRRFRGEADYPHMLALIEGCKEADGIERTDTADDIARNYKHLVNCDPYRDMQFVQVNGEVVGYGRVSWNQELNGPRVYPHFTFLLPQWRGRGIRHAMLLQNERRLREIAATHPDGVEKLFESWAADTESHWVDLLLSEGYQAVRFGYEMVRPDLENIPDLPLPPGLEVRPVVPEQVRPIWEAAREAFRDHWGYSDEGWEEELANMVEDPDFDTSLWQIAWDGDQVAGMVQAFIDREGNEEYKRKRGWTEGIAVRRPYRRKGLAKALIARAFRAVKEEGMEEAALGVDANNPNGALNLYKSMGFRVVKTNVTYRKPLV